MTTNRSAAQVIAELSAGGAAAITVVVAVEAALGAGQGATAMTFVVLAGVFALSCVAAVAARHHALATMSISMLVAFFPFGLYSLGAPSYARGIGLAQLVYFGALLRMIWAARLRHRAALH